MLLGMAMQDKRIVGVRPVSLEDAPQLTVDVDQDKARALGLDIGQINQTISSRLGRLLRQRLHRPRPRQARLRPGRRALSPAARGHFRTSTSAARDGKSMAPFTAFSTLKWANAPVQLSRYNGLPSLELQGSPAPGVSTGTAMKAMEEMQAKLPPGTALQWTGLSLRGAAVERPGAGALRPVAADRLPVPRRAVRKLDHPARGDPGGSAGHRRRRAHAPSSPGLDNNIYLQVGLITTMGLGAKNAILIVEFAEERLRAGAELRRGRGRSGQAPASADADDQLGLRLRRRCRWRSPAGPAPAARTRSAARSSAAPSPRPSSRSSSCPCSSSS